MKILIAPDKFKGSLSAQQVCKAIEKELKNNSPSLEVITHPMADGGDGSLAVLADHLPIQAQTVSTTDPIGRPIEAVYYTSGTTAFIEMASASGMALLSQKELNPLLTSTFGTGLLMAAAIKKGAQHIYLFLGGSATNDAGTGIAAALGYQFLDTNRQRLHPIGKNLSNIQFIERVDTHTFHNIHITLLCDVNNPLYGSNGAAYVYAKQKGANDKQIQRLDIGLQHFSKLIQQQFKMNVNDLPGAGAAGGIPAGLVPLFNAKLTSGFDTIASLTKLEAQIKAADWVISGEGKLDTQSLNGKSVSGIAQLCNKHNKPLSLFVGKNELPKLTTDSIGIKQVYAITDLTHNMEEAILNGSIYLAQLTAQFCKTLERK